MKKLVVAVALAASLMMCGCSDKGAEYSDGVAVIGSADVSVQLADDWSVTTGEAVYSHLAESFGYDSGAEMQKSLETSGQSYILCAEMASGSAVLVTSQDLSVGDDGEKLEQQASVDEYARTSHDSAIFGYLANGLCTGEDSSFSEQEIGGVKGWLSYFEVFIPDGEEQVFALGQTEFIFERDGLVYSVQGAYIDINDRETVRSVLNSITQV